jgi:hypothetical protein
LTPLPALSCTFASTHPTNLSAACYKLEEYESALLAFQQGLGVQPNSAQLDIWIQKCKNALTGEGWVARR